MVCNSVVGLLCQLDGAFRQRRGVCRVRGVTRKGWSLLIRLQEDGWLRVGVACPRSGDIAVALVSGMRGRVRFTYFRPEYPRTVFRYNQLVRLSLFLRSKGEYFYFFTSLGILSYELCLYYRVGGFLFLRITV